MYAKELNYLKQDFTWNIVTVYIVLQVLYFAFLLLEQLQGTVFSLYIHTD